MKLNQPLVAVITGGASGLCEATARRFAAHGVKVALFDINEEKGEALARELGGVFCKVEAPARPMSSQVLPGRTWLTAKSACWSAAHAPAAPSRRPASTARRAGFLKARQNDTGTVNLLTRKDEL